MPSGSLFLAVGIFRKFGVHPWFKMVASVLGFVISVLGFVVSMLGFVIFVLGFVVYVLGFVVFVLDSLAGTTRRRL